MVVAAGQLRSLVVSNDIFGALGPEDVEILLSATSVRNYAAHQPVFHQGDAADGVYVVCDGRVGIRTLSADGNEVMLNIVEPGGVFGEIAAIDGGPRTAGAVTMEPSSLAYIDARTFHRLLERSSPLCMRLLMLVCERLRWTSEIIEESHFHDVRARLIHRLIRLQGTYGEGSGSNTEIRLKVTQEMLARMLGVTRESVNKELMHLQRRGLITYNRGLITILDSEGLLEAAEPAQ